MVRPALVKEPYRANLSIAAHNVARSYDLSPDNVSLCVMPLFHVHGLVASTLATLATGGTVVVPAKFNPPSFSRVAKDVNATWYSAVPADAGQVRTATVSCDESV